MRASAEQLYPIVVLALLAGATLWLERSTREPEAPPAAVDNRNPDFVAETARLVSFDAGGARRYELVSDRISHFPRRDVSVLENPRLEAIRDAVTTTVTARNGEARAGGDEIFLRDAVRVRRTSPGAVPLELDALSLTIWPSEERARSDEAVTIRQGGGLARGNGLRADNLFGTLELIGAASVTIPPRSRTSP